MVGEGDWRDDGSSRDRTAASRAARRAASPSAQPDPPRAHEVGPAKATALPLARHLRNPLCCTRNMPVICAKQSVYARNRDETTS